LGHRNAEKGFGFITPDEGGPRCLRPLLGDPVRGYRSLEEDQKVHYTVTQGNKGPQASDVSPAWGRCYADASGEPGRLGRRSLRVGGALRRPSQAGAGPAGGGSGELRNPTRLPVGRGCGAEFEDGARDSGQESGRGTGLALRRSDQAVTWARTMLHPGVTVVIDCETTDLRGEGEQYRQGPLSELAE
jgi:CspA family cold shock protein